MLIVFFFNIAQANDDLITSEVHGSVSKNCVELNELPNDGKNNNTYGDEIIDWNEFPLSSLPAIVNLQKLVALNMPRSHIKLDEHFEV